MRARRPPFVALVVVAGLLFGLASCGTGTDRGATTIPPERVPFDLLAPPESTTSRPKEAEADDIGEAVVLFFVDGDRLEPVFRPMGHDPSALDVLVELAEGPTREEARQGLTTATPSSSIRGVTISRGIATVDLATTQTDVRSDQQALAVAQIVFTLTARPGIGRVAFTVDGDLVDVPVGSGALTGDAVAREDYPELAPPNT